MMPLTSSVRGARKHSCAPVGDLSPHFSRSEFREHDNGALVGPDPKLVQVLERIRALSGTPLRIVSGYRSRAYNRRIGGAVESQHIYGRAADIEAGRCTVAQALSCGAVGVGYDRSGWVVHVDVRPGRPVTFLDV
jgi:uncharacterized protein YcbK (DUF882 family)